jgi:hypothetical protein
VRYPERIVDGAGSRSKGKGPRGMEARLEAVRALRGQPATAELEARLAQALADRSNLVVAAAAELVAEATLFKLVPALAAAFDRLMIDPVSSDKTCRGKTAIARALVQLDSDSARVFTTGLSHLQLEPAFGPPEDTAPELRAQCALGLVRSRHPDAAVLVAERLADPSHITRAAVAQILVELELATALPLLHFKIEIGDEQPQVIAACFASLLELEPAAAVPRAAAYLDQHPGEMAEAVALTLGESRRREAFEVLRDWGERVIEARRVAYLALALMRDDRAFDHLIEVVASDNAATADLALAALSHFRHDQALCARALAAARGRKDRQVLAQAEARLTQR